jgi:hypothetical protein
MRRKNAGIRGAHMSTNLILIIVGVVLILAGLAKQGSSQSGGFNLSNFGINVGGRSTQTNRIGNVTPDAAKETKPDWIGFTIAGIGLFTALVGLLRG